MSAASRNMTKAQVLEENEELRRRLEEAEQTLEAIHSGEVDALVVADSQGEQIYTLTGAEHVYRVIVETMNEAALTVDSDGTILFCNQRFCDLMKTPMQGMLGRKIAGFAAGPQKPTLAKLLADVLAGPVQRRITLQAADGTAVPVQLAASLLHANAIISICLVASDLTELEASAHSIRVLRDHQQALEESEARFRAIFESSRDAVIIANDEGVCIQANPAVEPLFGLPSEQIVGRRVSEFLSNAVDVPTIWRAFLATGSFHAEMSLARAAEQVRHVDSYAVANILPGRHLLVLRDITDRKRAQDALQDANEQLLAQTEELQAQAEELRAQTQELQATNEELLETEHALREANQRNERNAAQLDAVFKQMTEGLVIFDPAGNLLDMNPAALAIHRFESLSGRGRHWKEVMNVFEMSDLDGRPLPEDAWPIARALRGETFQSYEVRVRFKNKGSTWIASYGGTPVRGGEGNQIFAVVTLRDVTVQKEVEQQLRNLTGMLEARVTQRTAELEYRAGQLQKLALELSQAEERERRRLAEILHDDLQQQLAAIKFHLGIMGSRTRGDAYLRRSTAQIDGMLGDAIETSRSLSHELSPAVMYHGDLGEIIEWLGNQIRAKHGMVVHVDAHGQIDAHSDGLKTFLYKAVQELLFNAVKHARVQEATVRLRRWGRYICLVVSDRGRGFDPQDLRQTAGFGLLSIRERIALLGGRMKIESAKGKGSRFLLIVPDSRTREAAERAAGRLRETADVSPALGLQPAASGRRLRVLIADDHEIVRGGLASLLSDTQDFEVVGEAGNGREAVDLAYQLQPDVVIMDVAMPLINGDEAARQIKKHLPQTRIVALSMYDEAGMVEKMHQAGAEAYVLKTAPYEELLAAVRGTK